jgi:hypothetical protein
MHRAWALGWMVIGVLAGPARAQVTEIYKCLDPAGRPLYTSDKRDTAGKKCDLVSREINVVPAQQIPVQRPSASSSRSGSFPRESVSDRANAKERQREILEKELTTEQQLLAKAQQDLTEQESVRSGDERNYARVLERLQPYKDSIEVHQKNVEALRRELSNLNR